MSRGANESDWGRMFQFWYSDERALVETLVKGRGLG
jgi:hypothetical protein